MDSCPLWSASSSLFSASSTRPGYVGYGHWRQQCLQWQSQSPFYCGAVNICGLIHHARNMQISCLVELHIGPVLASAGFA
jgi:hypothetical protein